MQIQSGRIFNSLIKRSKLKVVLQILRNGSELTRWLPELVHTFVYRGSSHRRKSAACPKFDMVWLYLSPIPVGRRWVISSFKWFLPAFATRRGGEEGRHPVNRIHIGSVDFKAGGQKWPRHKKNFLIEDRSETSPETLKSLIAAWKDKLQFLIQKKDFSCCCM